MSKLLNHLGEPIEKIVNESELPTTDQILQDPITKKFVFLNSETYPDQTCIGLTDETDYHGVIYKYGQVTIPDENKLLGDILYHIIIAQSEVGHDTNDRTNNAEQSGIQ